MCVALNGWTTFAASEYSSPSYIAGLLCLIWRLKWKHFTIFRCKHILFIPFHPVRDTFYAGYLTGDLNCRLSHNTDKLFSNNRFRRLPGNGYRLAIAGSYLTRTITVAGPSQPPGRLFQASLIAQLPSHQFQQIFPTAPRKTPDEGPTAANQVCCYNPH